MTAEPCPRCGTATEEVTLDPHVVIPYNDCDGQLRALVGGGATSRCPRCGLLGFHLRAPGVTPGTHRVVWLRRVATRPLEAAS